ncbi:unnamed protein product [marine sediment metagenome]|uniref:Uncharacterized protein n=1 Tax=marine sediment metagenome TaxID=412755 RepID=X1M301_9ZZZZ
MLGIIFTILGVLTIFRLWGDHTGLAIVGIIATLYQASSLNELRKGSMGLAPMDDAQGTISMIASLVILGLFIASFII